MAGWAASSGDGVAQNQEAARAWLQKSCDAAYADGCTELGVLINSGAKTDAEVVTAASLFARGCEQGSPRGCVHLGDAFRHGRGVSKDPARAAAALERACDAKDGDGCFYLGVLYDEGEGVARDGRRASSLWVQACDLDAAMGCTVLARRLLKSDTGSERSRGLALLTRSCDALRNGFGCMNLGIAHVEDEDVERGKATLARGCELGEGLACQFLGKMHLGWGSAVARDERAAHAWYAKGCKAGDEDSCKWLHTYESFVDSSRTPFARQVAGYPFGTTSGESQATCRKSGGQWVDAGLQRDGSHGFGCTKLAVDVLGVEAAVLLTFCTTGGLCEISLLPNGGPSDRATQLRKVLGALQEKYGKPGLTDGIDPEDVPSVCSQKAATLKRQWVWLKPDAAAYQARLIVGFECDPASSQVALQVIYQDERGAARRAAEAKRQNANF